jgi:hypothetical protein
LLEAKVILQIIDHEKEREKPKGNEMTHACCSPFAFFPPSSPSSPSSFLLLLLLPTVAEEKLGREGKGKGGKIRHGSGSARPAFIGIPVIWHHTV